MSNSRFQGPVGTMYTTNLHTVTTTDIKTKMHHIHTSIVSRHLATKTITKYCEHISSSEEIRPHLTLAHLRTNKSLFLKS